MLGASAPLNDSCQIWFAWVDPWCALTCQILSDSVFSVAPGEAKNPNLIIFQLCYFVAPGSAQRCRDKVHIYRHSPNQWYQSCLWILKSSWQSGISKVCYFKAWMTNRKTNKQKWHQTFSPSGSSQYLSTNKLGMVIEEVSTLLAPLKHVCFLCIILPPGGAENLG